MNEPYSRWQGFRNILNADGTAQLIANDEEVLAKTVGSLHGKNYFHNEPQNEALHGKPKGTWVVTEVLARGTHLWDPDLFNPSGPFNATQISNMNNSSSSSFAPLLIGYSLHTLEFVFATTLIHTIANAVFDDSLTTLQFHTVPIYSAIGPQAIVPHHSMTIPGNVAAFKKFFIRKDWERAFDGGDIGVDRAKELATQSRVSLNEGGFPIVVARINPCSPSQIPNNGRPNLDAYEDMASEPGPQAQNATNRRWKERLPEVKRFLLPHGRINGFVYKVPYMSNMRYPSELYEQLTKFARAHPHDKLNASAMLFAVQLWVDIMEHADRMLEPFAKKDQAKLPHVPLADFLIYFEPWLKVHEHLRCIQYTHPFRTMKRMFLADLYINDEIFTVKRTIIDEGKIRDMVLTVAAECQALPVEKRVDYFPFMMNGSAMAHPQDFRSPLSPTEQALIGMPDIRVLGLPSLHRQKGEKRLIAMPEPIARLGFNGIESILLESSFSKGWKDAAADGFTCQFGTDIACGTIWDHEFRPEFDPAAIRKTIWASSPEMDPSLPVEYFLHQPWLANTWFQKVRRRLAWLEHLGVMGKVKLECGPDGLPSYDGMPLEDGAHLLPPSTIPKTGGSGI
ncbi:hypothetical protein NM208_g9410 [Fusarium decemcellulare]|uniref:Uncharacterized protein n=1 Tax=Fusarium decemcellulare TaxID=57161 RepID=A0ACC1S1N2_9HYPO|nr:hypothetical protein NM208_g9410 [Fusarium decemcellulare]